MTKPIDYKVKALDYLAYEIAFEDIGIYPKEINGKKRTPYQDGWNACSNDLLDKAMIIGGFIETLDAEIQDLVLSEKIRISVSKGKPRLYVLCNDLFYWACADAEGFDLKEKEDLQQALTESPEYGELLWVCRKRKMRPQKPYYKYFSKQEEKLFNECGPKRDE